MVSNIHARGVDVTPAISEYLRRRLSHSLGKWEERLNSVDVYVRDLGDEQRGSSKKSVQVRIDFPGHPRLVMEAESDDLRVAISNVARRARRIVRRTVRHDDRITHFGLQQLAYGPLEQSVEMLRQHRSAS